LLTDGEKNMLVIPGRIGENLMIGDEIEVFVLSVQENQVKIGIQEVDCNKQSKLKTCIQNR
jgi:carbon storage regulator CsrA